MARVGDKLGRYELLEQLGKGAAGTVFRARDSLLGIDVCVKILHSGLATQPGIVERFKRELLLARRVAHPGICKIFDIQESGGTHFLTMEYVKGETLSTRLNRDGQMPAKDAVRLMRKVSEALGAAHKAGVVHRDIKPGNIIIGENERVTIVDFGVATAEDLDRLTRAGVVLGSRSYMAPESWKGKPATTASDVWALGVILYGCVTGRLPYKGEGVIGVFEAIKTTKPIPPSALNDTVTPELEALIEKAMCVDVEKRFPDASAVEAALATLELTLADEAIPTAVHTRPRPKPTRAPAASDERLHRPSAQPLPSPNPVPVPAPTVELTRTPAGVVESSVPSDELSLYAPGDPSAGSPPSGEQPDLTQPLTPLQTLTDTEAPSPFSAENVADAFDAAFDLGAAPEEAPSAPAEPAAAPAPLSPASVGNEGATVVTQAPPELASPPPADAGLGGESAPAPHDPAPLDFGSVAAPPSASEAPAATETASLEDLVASGFQDDKTALTESLSDAPLSLFPGPTAESSSSPLDTQLVEPLADTEAPAGELELQPIVGTPLEPIAPEGAPEGGQKRLLMVAAVAVVALVLVVALVIGLSGGEEDDDVIITEASSATSATLSEQPALEQPSAETGLAHEAASEPSDEGAAEDAESEGDPAGGAFDAGGLADELYGDLEEGAEGDTEAPVAADTATETDDVAPANADEPAVAEDDAVGEGSDTEALAAMERAPPAKSQVKPRKQRASPEAAARNKYNRKRAALNAALSRKGVRPGDVPSLDNKRQQMTQAARRRDYTRAADAADEALRELANVKIDAAFIGKKLARFNQGYDRTTDEALRTKLKGVLKDVGSDYSAGRFVEANKKLNRAFSLMRQ